jgi:hypothetical protein
VTDTIKSAAHATAQILAETHSARHFLGGDYSTINALVFSNSRRVIWPR